jgi:hypothetical protein
MPTKGYDAFFQPSGARGRMTCRVCGTECQVSRGRLGPTGFAEAVLGAEQPHDRFVCPHADLPWHNEALALLREAEAESDRMLRAFLDARREQWVRQHLARGD